MEGIIKKMSIAVRHRGPDADGIQILPGIGLGHRRLSVIDLHDRANQPMSDESKRLWIVFNGEIYNYRELRKSLSSLGYKFRTTSDTEVILYGWQEYGVGIFSKLVGMFAIAIWDDVDKNLVIARDRFGKKPLFYTTIGKQFLFSSESKSFFGHSKFSRKVNYDVIHDYLSFHYVIGNMSAFSGVSKLAPGHYLELSSRGSVSITQYWRPPSINRNVVGKCFDEIQEEFYFLFDQAIQRRLIADVPVGAFLSGGVDSSAVVARAVSKFGVSLKTFSVGFEEEGYDETNYAKSVSSDFCTDHYEYRMDSSLLDDLPKIIWYYGEPYADSSALVTYGLSRKIREHVKVALTGDGGDEIFLGYNRYLKFRDAVSLANKNGFPPLRNDWEPALSRPALKRDLYMRSLCAFRDHEKLTGYGERMLAHLSRSSTDRLGTSLENASHGNAIDLAARLDISTYLEGDLNVKADTATMAASLEGRSPFLDQDLAEWALKLPQSTRVFDRDGVMETKALLKKMLESTVDPGVMYRRKQGFSVPVRHWLRGSFGDFAYDQLSSKRFNERGLFTKAFVDDLFRKHRSGYDDQGSRIWTLVSLELWFQTFIDGPRESLLTM